jgi:hypothetical protein
VELKVCTATGPERETRQREREGKESGNGSREKILAILPLQLSLCQGNGTILPVA